MSKKPPVAAPTAYSYMRWSRPEQAQGDSQRRQRALRDAWIARAGAVLDTNMSLKDEGVSGFRGKHRENPDKHALAAFLALVKRGRIARGSYLVVESLDRLSREHVRSALSLLLGLIEAGIKVVQLAPREIVYDESADVMTLTMAIMEMSRAHEESALKRQRVIEEWDEKLKRAAESLERPTEPRVLMTKWAPAWLRIKDGQFVVDDAKAAAVRRVYALAIAGYGLGAITKKMNADGIPAIGNGPVWVRGYVNRILGSRSVLGEFQAMTDRDGAHRPLGGAIIGYYPAILSADQWHAAQAARQSRRRKGGRQGRKVNLFSGMAFDARDGGALHQVGKRGRGDVRSLVSYKADQGAAGSKYVSFPLVPFENAVLNCLREVDPRDILPDGDGAADRVLVLAGRLADVEGRLEAIRAALVEGGDVAALVQAARDLEARQAEIAADLADAQRAAASPLAAAWADYGSLADALQSAPDIEDARMRLRAVLRRVIETITCLFVQPPGRRRYAAVRVQFAGGGHRDYLILHRFGHRNPTSHREPETQVRSFASAHIDDGLDLRRRDHARRLEKVLKTLDLGGV
jgi:DNA invertase Pin-like site-specific DNA recombinase